MRGLRTTLALLAVSALAGASPAAAERIAPQSLPGFVLGYEAGNDEQSIREEVPAGETVQEWTRMVTTQWFAGAAERLTPTEFFEVITRNLMAGCPGAKTSAPVTSSRESRAAAQMRADCPRVAQTGKPETFVILAIAGDRDLHVKQVAFRRVPTAADLQWADEVLGAVAVCETCQD